MEIFTDQNFIMTDERYQSGYLIDEYNGRYSLINAYMGKDGLPKKKWVYTIKDEKADKMLPWKLDLGTKEEAIEVLRGIARLLNAEPDGPTRLPEPPEESPVAADEFDKIPF